MVKPKRDRRCRDDRCQSEVFRKTVVVSVPSFIHQEPRLYGRVV